MIIGGAGTGKSTRLMESIQRSVRAGETVLTLVPEQFSYEFELKLYRHLGAAAFNLLETYSFQSLSRAIFRRYGYLHSDATYADEMTKQALLHQSALIVSQRQHLLEVLEKQCRQPAFFDELGTLFSQFRRSGITPDQLYQTCNSLRGRLRDKVVDLFELYRCYDQLLVEHRLKDTESDLTEAASVANGQDAFLGSVLYLDEFDSFTVDEYEMLAVLLASCKDVYITLGTEDTAPAPFSLFSSVNDTLYRLQQMAAKLHLPVSIERCETAHRFHGEDLAWLSRHVFRSPLVCDHPMEQIHILEANTPSDEAEFTCTTIRRLLASDPTLRCRDVVVLTNQLEDYQGALVSAMERYGLPYHLDQKRPVSDTPLMAYLQTLLELLRQKRPDTELLLRYGKSELTACTMEEMATLEEYCYTWQIDGSTWYKPFTGGDCKAAEDIRQKLIQPLEELRQNCEGEQTGAFYCQILYVFLQEQQVEEKFNQQLAKIEDESLRMQLAEEWTFAWNSWIEVLDHIVQLYEAFCLTLGEFCSILAALLQRIERAIPPQTLDAILIAQGNRVRLEKPRVVFLLGVCEGVFPASHGTSTIFSERDCMTLAEMDLSVVKPKEEMLADARLSAYQQLSAASDALYLLYPQVDITHQKCYPASVLGQIQRMFPASSGIKTCASFGSAYYATTMPATYYRYIQDYATHTTETASMEQVLMQDPFYQERLASLAQMASLGRKDADAPLFQIQDTSLLRRRLGNRLWLSASSLERYQKCPFTYFCQDVLRLYPRKRIRLAGAQSGSLIHYCLEQLLSHLTREEFLALSPEALFQRAQAYGMAYWDQEMGGAFSKSGRELAVFDHTIEGMRQMLAHLQEELRQSAFYPRYLELSISPDNPDFLPLELQGSLGQMVQLVGKVDRVDVCQDGTDCWVRVVDYKTGAKEFVFGNLLYGLDMQMLIYLFTITAPHTALANARPAGVLYMPAGRIKSDQSRGNVDSAKKQYYDTYRMKGLMLQDPHLLQLMEADGRGLYVPGKLNASQGIDEKSGLFLTTPQMAQLRQYVLDVLRQMADRLYGGEIDADPLVMSNQDSCENCPYISICGNVDKRHGRIAEDSSKDKQKQMLERLEQEGGDA